MGGGGTHNLLWKSKTSLGYNILRYVSYCLNKKETLPRLSSHSDEKQVRKRHKASNQKHFGNKSPSLDPPSAFSKTLRITRSPHFWISLLQMTQACRNQTGQLNCKVGCCNPWLSMKVISEVIRTNENGG